MGIDINSNNPTAGMNRYTNPIRIASVDAVALHLQLERCKPADIDADERAALDEVKAAAENVRLVRIARSQTSPSALKEPRLSTSTAVSSLHGGLAAVASLSAEHGPEGPRAAEVVQRVFPDGTSFLRGDATAVWEGTDMVLQVIDAEGLGPAIDALVSPTLLRAVRTTHAKLRHAVVSGGVAPSVPSSALRDAMSRFTFAVAQYARALAGRVRHDDEASLAAFFSTLAPLDQVRVLGDKEEDDDVTEPSAPTDPSVPTDPTGPSSPFTEPTRT